MKLIERIRRGKEVIDNGTGFRCPYCGTLVHPYYMIFGENELRFCYACGKKIAIELEPARPRVSGRWTEYRVKLKGVKDQKEMKEEKKFIVMQPIVFTVQKAGVPVMLLFYPLRFKEEIIK